MQNPDGRLRHNYTQVFVPLILLALLIALSFWGYLLFHSVAEIFSIVIAFGIYFVSWNTREYTDGDHFSFLGIGLAVVGAVDMLHILAYEGMGVFPAYTSNLPTQLWIIARSYEAASLLIFPLLVARRINFRIVIPLLLAAGVVPVSLTFFRQFPDCFVPGQGLTLFKIISEYIIIAVLASAITFLLKKKSTFDGETLRLMILALSATILGELAFTLYINVYGISNMAGHFLKVLSFYFIYRATIERNLRRPFSFFFTELKRQQEVLSKSEKRYRLLYENSPASIYTWRYHEGDLFLDGCNSTASTETGGRANGLIGERAQTLYHHYPDVRASLEEAQKTGSVVSKEIEHPDFRLDTPAKEGFPAELLISPITDKLVLMHIRDITARVEAEQLRSDIESITRHDLKSPLNGIVMTIQLLQQDPDIQERYGRELELMADAGDKMQEMINRSLALYQIEKGTYNLKPRPLSIRPMLEHIRHHLSYISEQQDIDLLFESSEEQESSQNIRIFGEETLCFFLLMNLIKNAVEASPPGERVRISYGISREPGCAGRVEISVQNSGVIPESIQPVFGKKPAPSQKERGNGLGVYSARLMTEVQGGSFSWTSGEPEGTRITICLPAP
ncbi:MAG: PAS domain S-box protein [Spirochaetales bacterium]|nr:PAS domain S-box protein [Spirochaetales bacterium]MCF7937692.1 PAS domain S-box protein [Spirochaetales bacterium]